MLFFQCMTALLNPANRKRDGSKWGLACYTVAMFSCVTVVTATSQNIASLSFIDNREFPGVEGLFPPGPTGYQAKTCSGASGIAPGLGALLNSLLADGLLVSRLFDPTSTRPKADSSSFIVVTSSMAKTSGLSPSPALCTLLLWVRLRYLHGPAAALCANSIYIALGITILASHSCGWGDVRFILPHLSISVSLNVLLTLMIVIRLVLYDRYIRAVVGSPTGISGMYKTIVTMLIESSTLYAVNSLLVIGLWAAGSGASGIFLPALTPNQVGFSPLLQFPDQLSNVTAGSG